jgi:flagellar motility protein MotE (MotC chaperone)
MKKALIGAVMVMAVIACVIGGVVAGASLGGGVPPGSFLARIPGMKSVAGLQKSREDRPEKDVEPGEASAGAQEKESMPYVDLAPKDALKQMVRDLEQRVREVNNREEKLSRREEELEGLEKALKKQRKRITKLARDKKQELTALKKKIEQQRKKLQEQKIAMSKRRKENLEKAAKIYNRMDEARAAETLAGLYREGKQDTVVQIIYLMKDRVAAGVLAAMPEDGVGAEITRKLAHVSQESQ